MKLEPRSIFNTVESTIGLVLRFRIFLVERANVSSSIGASVAVEAVEFCLVRGAVLVVVAAALAVTEAFVVDLFVAYAFTPLLQPNLRCLCNFN